MLRAVAAYPNLNPLCVPARISFGFDSFDGPPEDRLVEVVPPPLDG